MRPSGGGPVAAWEVSRVSPGSLITTVLLLRTVWKGLGIAPSSPEPWFHAPWASLPSCRPFVADAFRGRRVNPLARVHERARASHAFASRLDSRFLLAFVCLRHDSHHVSTKGRPCGQEQNAVPAGGGRGGHREREGRGPPVLRPWPAALLRGRVSLSGCWVWFFISRSPLSGWVHPVTCPSASNSLPAVTWPVAT